MSLLRTRTLALLVAVLLAGSGQLMSAPSASAKIWTVPPPDHSLDPLLHLTEYETRVVHLINQERKAADLRPVRYFSGCIDTMSERWAKKIAGTGDLAHRKQSTVLRRCDLGWTGETVVRGTNLSPAGAVKAWLGSPPHRAVLMAERARHAGLGARVDGEGRLVGVLNFGDPA